MPAPRAGNFDELHLRAVARRELSYTARRAQLGAGYCVCLSVCLWLLVACIPFSPRREGSITSS